MGNQGGPLAQDCLALGVIFAATDSVAVLQVLNQDRMPLLYSLVFGEGVINDATSVALLRAVQVRLQAQRKGHRSLTLSQSWLWDRVTGLLTCRIALGEVSHWCSVAFFGPDAERFHVGGAGVGDLSITAAVAAVKSVLVRAG